MTGISKPSHSRHFHRVRKRSALIITVIAWIFATSVPAVASDRFDDAITQISALAQQAKYEEALQLAEQSADEARTSPGRRTTTYARVIGWRAYLLQVLGRFSEARPLFEESLEIYEAVLPAGHPDIATAANNLAFQYQVTDRLLEAEALYKRALDMREKALPADDPLIADSLNNIAQVYKHEGRTLEAIPLLERSLALRLKKLKPGDPRIAQSLANIGSALERLGRFQDAERYLRKSLAIRKAAQAPDHPELAGAINKLAQNLSSQGRFEEADKLFLEAFSARASSLPADHPDVANNLHDRAQNLNALHRYAEAETLLRQAIEIRRKILPENHPSIAHTIADLASVVLSQGRPAEAMDHIREGVRILLARGKLDELGKQRFREFVKIAWRLHLQDASAPETKPLLDEAFRHAQRATATPTSNAVARMAARFSANDESLKRLIDERGDLETLAERLDRDLSASLALPASKRAVSADRLRADIASVGTRLAAVDAKLKEGFPKYFDLVNPAPLDIENVQALLKPDEVMLDFLSTSDEVYLWAVSKTAAQWHRLDISPGDLTRDITKLRKTLDTKAITTANAELFELGLAHELYRKLLLPVQDMLPEGTALITVANGALTSLPLQTLIKSPPAVARPSLAELSAYRDADWLARHHAVSVLPSVTSLKAIRQDSGHALAQSPLVGFGNPILAGAQGAGVNSIKASVRTASGAYSSFWRGPAADMDAIRGGLAPLPETETELRTIAERLSAGDDALKLGSEATETAVKSADLSHYRIVYFATHGLVAGEVQGLGEPALVFSLPAVSTEMDDGLLTASEVTQLHLDADWVVLSACNTAAGQTPGAEALSGLARAFFHAGTRALLVSHWRVGSDAAAQLTTSSFEIMQSDPNIGRAEAVRRAMMKLASDAKDPWNGYPTFWAPFSVVGEGSR